MRVIYLYLTLQFCIEVYQQIRERTFIFVLKKKKNETKVVRLNYENLNIPKDWKDILENSSTGVNDSILKPYIFKKDLKSNFFRLLRKIIHNFIFFLPLSSRLYYRFNVWPNLKLRELFSLKT